MFVWEQGATRVCMHRCHLGRGKRRRMALVSFSFQQLKVALYNCYYLQLLFSVTAMLLSCKARGVQVINSNSAIRNSTHNYWRWEVIYVPPIFLLPQWALWGFSYLSQVCHWHSIFLESHVCVVKGILDLVFFALSLLHPMPHFSPFLPLCWWGGT